MEERLDIDTPESVAFGYQVAGIGSRFLAALADTLLLGLVFLSLFCGLGALASISYASGLDSWMVALGVLFTFVLIWGYYIFFEIAWNGQSPGKRLVGLRVVRTDGMPITGLDALIRNLVRVIDFLPLYYALGMVVMFANPQSRRLGDYAAGTLVVKEQRGLTLERVQQTLAADVAAADVAGAYDLGESDYRLIDDFLSRRQELRNRDQLAQRIGSAVAAKLGLPPPVSPSEAEALLVRVTSRSKGDPSSTEQP